MVDTSHANNKQNNKTELQDNDREEVSWKTNKIILDHRHGNQRIEYLITNETYIDSSAYWVKETELKGNPIIKHYLENLPKSSMRSWVKNSTVFLSKHELT